MGTRSFFKLAGATGCIAAICIAAPAQAGIGVISTVNLKLSKANPAKFKGKVKSAYDECVVGRKVLIMRKEGPEEQKVTKTFATESGKYSVKIPQQAGNKLFARIESTIVFVYNCSAYDSKVLKA
jgi:hypothetical protein